MGLAIKSKGSIFSYLKSLEDKGYLKKSSVKRGLDFIDKAKEFFVDVPVLGAASAGAPTIFAQEYVQGYLKVSKRIVRNKKVFAVQVHGTSMNLSKIGDKKINDGDFIIVDSEDKDYKNGDRLLVVIDGLATVKKFKKISDERIALLPETTDNEKHRPIYLTPKDYFIINGKVIEVLKS
jgi:SOS-response transcriptional repressor LexA